jgi:hypothetical protein
MPSTQRMDEEGRGKGMGKPRFKIYFFMTSALRLAAILDGPKSGHYYSPPHITPVSTTTRLATAYCPVQSLLLPQDFPPTVDGFAVKFPRDFQTKTSRNMTDVLPVTCSV